MKKEYEAHTDITKELLDGIMAGDLIRVNDWKKPMRVKGVSKDYFIMEEKQFGKSYYSVCEKKRWNGGNYNEIRNGMFHVGRDSWIFGAPIWFEFCVDGKYDFQNKEAVAAYLSTFELSDEDEKRSTLSQRNAIPIYSIFIKRFGTDGGSRA